MIVTLVGAGPGDYELMTLKGIRAIQNADVVLYDRFVSKEILEMIPDNAELINVGKTAGNHPVPQDEINRLLLTKAQAGLSVVRLKGGDPFVFGRGGEELELLRENNIPFEVVPGITTAIAGAAYAGIPVTHRQYASSLHIITGHKQNDEELSIDYEALVRLAGTLVFMMGVSAIEAICKGCLNAGMARNMPAAIVENATTKNQRKFIGTVETLHNIALRNNVISPAVIIIGRVCELSNRYDWFSACAAEVGNNTQSISPRTEKRKHNKSIIVSASTEGTSKLSKRLREQGYIVTDMPLAKITPLTSPGSPAENAISHIEDYSWLVLTSVTGVNVLFDYLIEKRLDIRNLRHLKIACVGNETENALLMRGICADFVPLQYNGPALASGLCELTRNGEKLLIMRAKDSSIEMTQILSNAQIKFDDIATYEKTYPPSQLSIDNVDYAAFTSSSAVNRFADAAKNIDICSIKAICIGNQTATTAKLYGMETFIAAEATISSLVDKIKELTS